MADDYAREVAKVAVGQIADLAGYEQTHCNALEAVADVLVRYIREIGLYAKEFAELQNRTDVAAPDVVEAVGDMGHTCSDLHGYLLREPRDPFAHMLPQFPILLRAVRPPSFKKAGMKPPANVPDHLPAFPDVHTMKFTALHRKRLADARQDHIELSNKRRKAEKALIQLHQKQLTSAGATKRNPFESDAPLQEAEPLDLEPPKSSPAGVAGGIKHVFEEIIEQEAAAATAAATQQQDQGAEEIGNDDSDADNADTWHTVVPQTEALESEGFFKSGRIGFSVDAASQLDRLAARSHNAWSVEDAFEKGIQSEGGGRRRTSMFDTEKLKKKRASTILDLGPDAIDMDDRHHDDDAY